MIFTDVTDVAPTEHPGLVFNDRVSRSIKHALVTVVMLSLITIQGAISQYLLHTKLEYRPRASGLVISYIFVFIAENIDITCKRALTT